MKILAKNNKNSKSSNAFQNSYRIPVHPKNGVNAINLTDFYDKTNMPYYIYECRLQVCEILKY